MRPPQPHGHNMVINLKTTVMTHGGHSGVIVHSGIQSSSSFSSLNGLGSWAAPTNSRIPMIETPGGTRMASAASPLPLTIGPSTSQDNLNMNWSRPSPQIAPAARATSMEYLNSSRESREIRETKKVEKYERVEPRRVQHRRPPTPPSPVYDFTGRYTPPDEFIKPSKVTLNVFDPGQKTPVPYEVGLRRGQISTADALINDAVTTTTTVEVFRAPYDPSNPNRTVALPPAPAPGLDDRPQLLRLDGPAYERWNSSRTETLINDRPVVSKGVKWDEKLVDRSSEMGDYDTMRLSGSRSPFANAVEPPRPPSANYQYYVPTVQHVDERLVPPMVTRSTSPYMLRSPSEFSMTSHPMITNSQEDIRRTRADSVLSYLPPTESPSQLAQLRSHQSYLNGNLPEGQKSPRYVEPRRPDGYERGREAYRREIPVDNYGYSTVDRRHSGRRAKSSHKSRNRVEELRARSVSPLSRTNSWAEDPNRLPHMPLNLSTNDTTHLYQTRDAFDNIITQFNEIEMADFDGGFLLSPMGDSNESLISETSARNDRAKSDLLELRSPEAEIYKIAEEFYNSRSPLMTSQSADNIYTVPRKLKEKLREQEEEEHIYEELDNIRPSASYSNLASVYATVPPEYDEIPPLLPPRRRKELTSDFLTTDSNPLLSQWLPDTPEATLSKASSPEVPRGHDSSLSSKSSTSSSSSEEAENEKPSSDESLGTTTADSSDSFVEVLEEDWPPPPSIMRGRKKVHPDGHVFPRITSSVNLMPLLPEDKEISSSEAEDVGGIKLSPVVDIDVFPKEPKPGSTLNSSVSSSSSEDESKVPVDDLPYMDASPRVA